MENKVEYFIRVPSLSKFEVALNAAGSYNDGGSLVRPMREVKDVTEPRVVNASLQVDRGTYVVRGRVFNPSTGKMQQRSKSTGLLVKDHTKRKAERVMREIVERWTAEANAEVVNADPTFEDYVLRWIEKKRMSLKSNTIRCYEDYARLHVLPALGNMRIHRMKLRDLQSFYNRLSCVLSVSSLKKIHVIISGALLDAVRDGIIGTNFAAYVEFPKAQRFEGTAYKPEQVAALLAAAKKEGEPVLTAIILAVSYGLRRSEICGLRWADIDFDAGILNVRNTVVQSGDAIIETAQTKTAKSRRTINLIKSTVPHLIRLRDTQMRLGLTLDKVCVWSDGRAVRPDYLTHRISKLMERSGLPHIRVHDLRHTAASLLSAKASPKQVQEFLGHEDIATSMNIYTHLMDAERAATSDIMDGIWTGILDSAGACSETCSET